MKPTPLHPAWKDESEASELDNDRFAALKLILSLPVPVVIFAFLLFKAAVDFVRKKANVVLVNQTSRKPVRQLSWTEEN